MHSPFFLFEMLFLEISCCITRSIILRIRKIINSFFTSFPTFCYKVKFLCYILLMYFLGSMTYLRYTHIIIHFFPNYHNVSLCIFLRIFYKKPFFAFSCIFIRTILIFLAIVSSFSTFPAFSQLSSGFLPILFCPFLTSFRSLSLENPSFLFTNPVSML